MLKILHKEGPQERVLLGHSKGCLPPPGPALVIALSFDLPQHIVYWPWWSAWLPDCDCLFMCLSLQLALSQGRQGAGFVHPCRSLCREGPQGGSAERAALLSLQSQRIHPSQGSRGAPRHLCLALCHLRCYCGLLSL